MKLLLDQGLPRSTAELLRQSGLDAVHTGECGLSVASDDEILAAGWVDWGFLPAVGRDGWRLR